VADSTRGEHPYVNEFVDESGLDVCDSRTGGGFWSWGSRGEGFALWGGWGGGGGGRWGEGGGGGWGRGESDAANGFFTEGHEGKDRRLQRRFGTGNHGLARHPATLSMWQFIEGEEIENANRLQRGKAETDCEGNI